MLLAGAGFKNEEDAKKWVPVLKRTPAANPEWPIDPQPAPTADDPAFGLHGSLTVSL
jgi:hypothetical protein